MIDETKSMLFLLYMLLKMFNEGFLRKKGFDNR